MCKLKILAVDDEHTALQIFKATLTDYDVTCVESGEAAIEACKSQVFDLVLMDISMPGIGGVVAIKHLMDSELVKYPSRIWGISAFQESEYVDAALEAGARDFFHKPIRAAFLKARIKTVVESIKLYHENQKALKWWKATFDMLPDPATVTDPATGRYISVNKAFLDEIDLEENEVVGQTPVSLGIISQQERNRFYRELSKTGYVKNMEIVYRYKDGKMFYGSISARLIKNGTSYIISVTRNETEHRALREKTQALGDKVRRYEQISANLQEVSSLHDEVDRLLQNGA